MNNQELYEHIFEAIKLHRRVETDQDLMFVHEISLEATEGAQKYLEELEEANQHLRDSIKRLTHGGMSHG